MKLSKTIRKTVRGVTYVPGRVAYSGKFSVPADEPPADKDPKPDDTGSDQKPTEKTFTQAEVNKMAAKEKAEGRRAAEKHLAESLGVSLEEAKTIIETARKAEDEKKSEAQKELEKAAKEREAAEAEKREAAAEKHEARIERALVAAGFSGDDKKMARVRKMITVEVGASYEDVLADVNDAKSEFPEIFAGKDAAGADDKPGGKLPNSDPKGKPAKPNGGEDKYSAGAKRFEAEKKTHRGYNPLEPQTT